MTKVVGKIPVPGLPHLGDQSLQQGHSDLGGNVDDPLVEEKAHVPIEKVGDVLQHRLVPAGGCLLQQERSQPRHALPAQRDKISQDLRPALRWKQVLFC